MMVKKIGSILLVMVFCLQMVVGNGMVYGTEGENSNTIPTGDDILVVGHTTTSSGVIYSNKNNQFKLKSIVLLNRTGTDISVEKIFIEQNSSFFVGSGMLEVKDKDENKKDTFLNKIKKDENKEILFSNSPNITYGGGEGSLPIVISYKRITKNDAGEDKIGDLQTFRTKLNINVGGEKPEEKEPEEKEPELGYPSLQISMGRMPEGKVGQKVNLRLYLENTGTASATNVSVTPDLGSEGYFEIAEGSITKTISKLRRGDSDRISYNFYISDKAKKGTHPIRFQVRYTNGDKPEEGARTEEIVGYIQVTNQKSAARLQVTEVFLNPNEVKAGEELGLRVTLQNAGGFKAQQIKMALEGLNSDGFTLVDGLVNQYIKDLDSDKSASVFYRLRSSEKMKNGNHELTFKISYQEEDGELQTEEHKIFIPVIEKEKEESLLSIENIVYPEGSVHAGQDFSFGFDLVNLGKADAKNIKISVAQTGGENIILPKSSSIRVVPKLKGEETQSFNFIMTSSKEAITQNYPIGITVEYESDEEDENGQLISKTVNQYVGVYIVNPKKDAEEDASKTVPKIIIDEYSLDPGIVQAGRNFNLKTTFLNTSSKKAIQNIKISLVVVESSEKTGTVFTPVQSSNTFYIDRIAPKQKATKDITLYTIPDAQAKTYTITVKFEYEDDQGEPLTAEDLIGIPVVQPSRLDIGEVQIQGEPTEGEPIGLYVEFYNTGKVTLNNLMVRLESDEFDVQDPNLFIGNFQEGSTEYFDRAMIIPRQAGPATGKLVFTYEDPTGEQLTAEKEIAIDAMEMFIPPMDDMTMPDDMEEPSKIKKIFTNKYLWMGLILAGCITAGWIVRKRRKVQEGLDLDE